MTGAKSVLLPRKNEVLVYSILTPSINKGFPEFVSSLEDNPYMSVFKNHIIVTGVVDRNMLNRKGETVPITVNRNYKVKNVTKESYQAFKKRQKKDPFARINNSKNKKVRSLKVSCLKDFIFYDLNELEEAISFFMGIEYENNDDSLMLDGVSTLTEVMKFFRTFIITAVSARKRTRNVGYSLSVDEDLSAEFLAIYALENSLETLLKGDFTKGEALDIIEKNNKFCMSKFLNSMQGRPVFSRGSGFSNMSFSNLYPNIIQSTKTVSLNSTIRV